MRLRTVLAITMAALLAGAGAPSALGAITTTTGAVSVASPPPSVNVHDTESDTDILAFTERQDVALGTGVDVDITEPGFYDEVADRTPATIPAGTPLRSYYLHVDPVDEHSRGYTGSLTFERPVVGIITGKANLDASAPPLGAPGTDYSTVGQTDLGFARPHDDKVELSADRRTVSVQYSASGHSDDLRILTEGRREVAIDVKPGSDENPVNTKKRGSTPVAILSDDDLNARDDVDAASLTFGADGDEASVATKGDDDPRCATEDVDADGDQDLVCHFPTEETGIEEGDTTATLHGSLTGGTLIGGTDTIRAM